MRVTPRRHAWRVVLVCVATVVSASVLIGSTHASPSPNGSGWLRSDLHPVTQPVAMGGKFVFYEAAKQRLRVIALDARSGKTVWSLPATVSHVTQGVAPELDVSGSRVIALLRAPREPALAVLGAIDVRSGTVAWTSVPGHFTSPPGPCADDAEVICVTGTLSGGQGDGGLRFERTTGKLLESAPIRDGGRDLGGGLIDPGLRDPEYLVATKAGAIAWRQPLARVFGPGASSDNGWNFVRVHRLGLIVGSVAFPPLKRTSTFVTYDLARAMTAGLRVRDGAVAWRDRGAHFECESLPCPGQPLHGYTTHDAAASELRVGLRMRLTGTVRSTKAKVTLSPNAQGTLEGFDPRTGRTLWSFHGGRSIEFMSLRKLPPQPAVGRIILRAPNGRYVDVNLSTGARRTVGAATRGWCRGQIIYKQVTPGGQEPTARYIAQASLYACDATGRRISPPSRVPAIASEIGAASGGIVAWSDTTGVVAARAA